MNVSCIQWDTQISKPSLVSLVVVVRNVPLEFVHKQWFPFLATSFVANGVFNLHLIKNSAIVEFNKKCIADRAFRWLMIVDTESFILYTINFGPKGVDTRIGCRLIGAKKKKIQTLSKVRA
jgi:hypothetical protein